MRLATPPAVPHTVRWLGNLADEARNRLHGVLLGIRSAITSLLAGARRFRLSFSLRLRRVSGKSDMTTAAETYEQAVHAYRVGDHQRAATLCRQILLTDPNQPDVLSLFGFTCLAQGRPDATVEYCERALRASPNHVDAQNALGIALAMLKRWNEAETSFRQLVRLRPDLADGHNNLGITLKEQGKLQDAEASYRNALRLSPNSAEGHNNLGNALKDQGNPVEAEACFRHALRIKPNYAEAYHNLGLALKERGRLTDAELAYRQALQLRPAYADAQNNLGNVLNGLGRLAESEACYHQALRANPSFADAHNNLGVMLTDQGRFEEAAAHYLQALSLQPNYPGAHYNFAMHLLLRGDYERGWNEYEWRWQVRKLPPHGRSFTQPLWDGGRLDGRTILLHTEQGMGDAIQFVRYATVAKALGGTVIVECQKALVPLFGRCAGVDHVVPEESSLPHFDVQAPVMTLPRVLGTTLESVPAPIPYLKADPGRVAYWRQELAKLPGFKVGIIWRGSANYRSDHIRSIPLSQFEPLAKLEGVHLFSLQKGPGRDELPDFAAKHAITDWDDRLDGAAGPFLDTAAIMMGLDLVISADTAPGHLAGALGVPVWIALPVIPDWRWHLDRDNSPWYPTVRLFRQTQAGNWQNLFGRMAGALVQYRV